MNYFLIFSIITLIGLIVFYGVKNIKSNSNLYDNFSKELLNIKNELNLNYIDKITLLEKENESLKVKDRLNKNRISVLEDRVPKFYSDLEKKADLIINKIDSKK